MDEQSNQTETGCCLRFNSEPWWEKTTFDSRLFLKDSVRSFLHIPLDFGSVMTKNMAKIEAVDALHPEVLVLSDEKSNWKSDLYIAVTKEVSDTEMARLSDTFLTGAFEGSYKDMSKWIKATQEFVGSRGEEINKMYFFYTTCPKCARAYGKNYTMLLA